MTTAPHPPETPTSGTPVPWNAEVRETHSSVVLLMGDLAYKVKKPVDLGFLDFSTRAAREQACHRELALNRRLAPDVYLQVLDVVDGQRRPREHLLVMRRMPDDRRLTLLLRQGIAVEDDLRHLARDVAAFHATARRGPLIDEQGTPAALRRRWTDNLRSLRNQHARLVPAADLDEIERLTLDYLDGCAGLLEARIRAGYIRDGHGDLLADDIFFLPDGPRALDCLDFDDRLRYLDVLDDVCCLAMDLERLGHPDAARTFVNAYAEFSGTRQPPGLAHHYVAYRAVMRAKVTALRERAGGSAGELAAEEAAQLCAMGLRHLRAARPRLVLVGGAPASGKSSLAEALADELGLAVLGSDRIRKELAGLPPTADAGAPLGTGVYTDAMTARTYACLAARAHGLLGMGESVLVDATFTRADQRELLRATARQSRADLTELRCTAAPHVVADRLRRRAAAPHGVSDADADIARALAAGSEPWPEAHIVDTGGPRPDTVAAAFAVLGSATAGGMP